MSEVAPVNGDRPRKVSSREVRTVVQTQGKALAGLLPAVQALANNDRLTRQRLEAHERRLDSHEAFEMMTRVQRLLWLLTGVLPVYKEKP